MKAQAVFEFIIAALVFLSLVMYIFNYMNTTFLSYENEHAATKMESEALRISEVLVRTNGSWVSGTPRSPGLEKDWPVLDSQKISWLNASCKGSYNSLLRTLDIDPMTGGLDIDITEMGTGKNLVECQKSLPEGIPYAHARRVALSESGKLLRIDVYVW